jgi:hypothetical protein
LLLHNQERCTGESRAAHSTTVNERIFECFRAASANLAGGVDAVRLVNATND